MHARHCWTLWFTCWLTGCYATVTVAPQELFEAVKAVDPIKIGPTGDLARPRVKVTTSGGTKTISDDSALVLHDNGPPPTAYSLHFGQLRLATSGPAAFQISPYELGMSRLAVARMEPAELTIAESLKVAGLVTLGVVGAVVVAIAATAAVLVATAGPCGALASCAVVGAPR